jgi:ABC-type transport system involved in Fe-S cluster assembly fused permease/ATPase subunit
MNTVTAISDPATSDLVIKQTTFQNLMEHRAVTVIAHRLSTVRRADRIVVLESGRIIRNRHPRRIDRPGRPLPAPARDAVPRSRRRVTEMI